METKPFPRVSDRSLTDLFSLNGRVAVVTGAARGIGQAIARRLHEAGAHVVLADWRDDQLNQTANQLAGQSRVRSRPTDVSDSAQVEALADYTVAEFGQLDIWVNDAGLLPVKAALDIDDAEWHRIMDTNLTGTFYGARAAGKRMKERGGTILNVASSLAFHSAPEQPHYVASKWGVRGLTAALANDWGKYGIRVVAVGPGLTDTPGVEANMSELNRLEGGDAVATTSKMMPAGRLGEPDDIARMVVVLVSDLAAYVTGAEYLVDGGEVYSSPASK